MKKIKICLIPYLNASILQYDFLYGKLKDKFETIVDFPCNCAEKMERGEIDLALIPSIEFQNLSSVKFIKKYGIISQKNVESVILISKSKKLSEIKKIGLTNQSRTSVALLKILCFEKYGINPHFEVFDNLKNALKTFDSILIIGDDALTQDFNGYKIYDLGREWYNWQNLPFVFAFWGVRNNISKEEDNFKEIEEILSESYKNGMENMEKIVEIYSEKLNLKRKRIKRYLTDSLTFELGKMELEGLKLFYQLCYKNKIIGEIKSIT